MRFSDKPELIKKSYELISRYLHPKHNRFFASMAYLYFNRDISWLSFNYRVLQEAYDDQLPLYERLKFLAIYSNNLEEFYRVRVSYYKSLIRNLQESDPKYKEVKPRLILHKINAIVSNHQGEFNHLFYDKIIPLMEKEGIILVDRNTVLNTEQEEFIEQIFRQQVLSTIQPVLLVRKRIKPFLKTGHIYIALRLFVKSKTFRGKAKASRHQYGLVKLPTDHNVARFIELPQHEGKYYIMLLEDLIIRKLESIFPGYIINSAYSIKVTRDADLELEDEDIEDLIEIVEKLQITREIGAANRFQYDRAMPRAMLKFFVETLDIDPEILVSGGRTHNFRDLFKFPNPKSPQLEREVHVPLSVPALESVSIFEKIEENDYLLHFPYQSFNYFLDFLKEAGKDPGVEQIYITQYRVATDSAVVEALIQAALNGKKVTVFVELKARFDEEMNLAYAKEMRQAGINIIYSIPGLKVHSKVAMICQTIDNKSKDLAFLGTGNFNEKTARLYGDHGFFTSDERIVNDLKKLFFYFENQNFRGEFKHILVPNYNMIDTYKRLIDREIDHVAKGGEGYIIIKINGLEDPVMIDKLYEASIKGVRIDIIVRGVCRLVPEMPYSKNINLIRIVDRFLEHARVFYFKNMGNSSLYMGSADWMKRNLYRRIECVFPIYNEALKNEVLSILQIQLRDNVSARYINRELDNMRIENNNKPVRSQVEIYNYLKNKIPKKE